MYKKKKEFVKLKKSVRLNVCPLRNKNTHALINIIYNSTCSILNINNAKKLIVTMVTE